MAEKTGNDKTGDKAKRRGRAFHRPTHTARHHLRKAAARKGFAETDVLLRWAEAVGSHLSAICQPVKVSYGGAIGATLTVRVTGARAPEVEHESPRIIERINSFYGYKAISRLKLVQTTGERGDLMTAQPGFAEHQQAFAGDGAGSPKVATIAPPDAATQRKAKALAEGIQNPDLRAALAQMGAWVLANADQKSKPRSHRDKESLE